MVKLYDGDDEKLHSQTPWEVNENNEVVVRIPTASKPQLVALCNRFAKGDALLIVNAVNAYTKPMLCFAMAVQLVKHTEGQASITTTSRMFLGYRYAVGKNSAIGDFVSHVLETNEGFAIADLVVTEVKPINLV